MLRPDATKNDIRQAALKRRTEIPPDLRREASLAACDVFFKNVDIPPSVIVAGYWPIREELDDLPILQKLVQRGGACALPRVGGDAAPLSFHLWDGAAPMAVGRFGVSEPPRNNPVTPGIILVPMAAFDKRGWRLGYGKGFYDRTITHLRERGSVQAIGLAFEMQICDHVPSEEHDVRMDMIITDRNVYK